MKARINVKFIIILLVLAVGVTSGVGVLWKLRQGDASRNIRLGDELVAQGELRSAVAQYRRAVRLEPGNRETLRKLEETLLRIQPQTSDEARELYTSWMAVLNHDAQHYGHLPETHLRIIRELTRNAQIIGIIAGRTAQRNYWRQLSDAAETMLERLTPDVPERDLGHLYHALANIQQFATLSESQLDNALAELREFVEEHPDHDFGLAVLARSERTLADHFRAQDALRKADTLETDYRRTIERLGRLELTDDKYPESLHVYVHDQIRRGAALADSDAGAAGAANAAAPRTFSDASFAALADRIYDIASDTEDPVYLHNSAAILLMMRDMTRIDQAIELYHNYLARHPDDHIQRYMVAMVHYHMDRAPRAENLLNEILDAERLPTGFISQIQLEIRKHAAGSLVDIAYVNWRQAAPDDKPARLEDLRERREQLASFVAARENDPLMLRAEAKLALAEGDFTSAASNLERLVSLGFADHETYSNAAYALEMLGQVGLAHERMTQAIAAMPYPVPNMLLSKAAFELKLGRYEDAQRTLDDALAIAPDDPRALNLAQQLRIATGLSAVGDRPSAESREPRAESREPTDPVLALLAEAQRSYEQGDWEQARAIIQRGLSEHGESVGLLAAAAQVELAAADRAAARHWLDRAHALQPNNPLLRQLDAAVQTDDPIERIERYHAATHPDNHAERLITTLLAVNTLAQHQQQLAQRAAARSDRAIEQQAAGLAERAELRVNELLEEAQDVAPDDVRVVELRIQRAIAAGRWEEAEQLIDRAGSLDIDEAGGLMLRGAYQLERGRNEQAVRTFQAATQRTPYSSRAWRGLGVAYTRVGNLREARRAFEESYRINPNDPNTVRDFLALLQRLGDQVRALRIAQNARRVFPNDPDIREQWLQLEAATGDQMLVLAHRRRQLEQNPDDRDNAVRLAMFLSRTDPADHLLLDENGERRYSQRRWSTMPVSEQRRVLEQERQRWRQEVDGILSDLRDRFGTDLELVSLEATIEQMRGDFAKGEQRFREYFNSLGEDNLTVEHRLALAQYLLEGGRYEQSVREIEAARELQSPEMLEADLVLANVMFSLNQYQEARDLFERVDEVAPSRETSLRLIESLVHVGEVEEAERRMQAFLESEDPGGRGTMIRALIAGAYAQRHFQRAETTEATRRMQEHDMLIEEAASAMPTDPSPHLVLAQTKLNAYRQTRQRAYLDQAAGALRRAEELMPSDPRVLLMRADVMRERGDRRGAITEMTRLIEQFPTHAQAHHARLSLYVESGDAAGAVSAARQAAETFPQSARWQSQYAQLLAETGDFESAAEAYRRAFELEPTAGTLARSIAIELRVGRLSDAALLQQLRDRSIVDGESLLESSVHLQALETLLTARTGDERAAEGMARRSYAQLRADEAAGGANRNILAWYDANREYFNTFTPIEFEQFVNELTNDSPGPYDLLWLGRFWARSGPEGFSRALELLQQADASAPRDARQMRGEILFELSGYQLMRGDMASAVETLQRVVELAPDNPMARNNLAFLLAEHFDRPQEALTHAEFAYERLPNNPSVVDTMGWVQFKLGRHSQAEDLLRQSLQMQDTATTRVHMARLLMATNRADSAEMHLQQAQNLNPDRQTQEEIARLLDDIRTR